MSIAQGEKHRLVHGKVTTLVVSLAVIAFILGALAPALPATGSIVRAANSKTLSGTNPELMVAGRYMAEQAAQSDAGLLSTNPELMAFRSYVRTAAANASDAYLAANPELICVQHCRPPQAGSSASVGAPTLEANPELIIFQRYASGGATT
jgi:hypothetical protein